MIRDFIALLNILHQNPEQKFEQIIFGSSFAFSSPGVDTEALTPETEIQDELDTGESPYANFQL